MRVTQNGHRIDILEKFLKRITTIGSHFDDDGIAVRFLNSSNEHDSVQEEDITEILRGVRFYGATRLGTALFEKVLQKLVLSPARARRLNKPVLVTIITDGKVRVLWLPTPTRSWPRVMTSC